MSAARADASACAALIRGGSRSFFAASLLLPKRFRRPVYALYAFCRLSDDDVDRAENPARAVIRQRERLGAVYGEAPLAHPVDREFRKAVHAYGVPRALPDALIEGFAWDAAGRRYRDLPDLVQYAVRVAGSVGVMMALIMGARRRDAFARASDLGVAMQLTNIARDVGEDARAGRLYLPERWLEREGVESAAWLARPRFDARIARVIERVLDAADGFYDRGRAGVDFLPPDCRTAIVSAADIYQAIGDEIKKRGYNSLDERARTGAARKLALIAHAATAPNFSAVSPTAPPHAAARFLIDATPEEDVAATPPFETAGGPMERTLDLLMRLERRDQARALSGAAAA